jgi:uncharacterized protein YdeI (YjbR/CyaY-like superfamily)
MTPKPVYFSSPAEFRKWLERHHSSKSEVWVGYYKKGTGVPSLTWPESVDEALCFGWIDGIRKSVDEERYTIRFTPRKPKSNWSNVNIARVAELTEAGRMNAAGLKAFQDRDVKRQYSYEETRRREFTPEQEKTFRANRKAWAFFNAQPQGYRKTLIYWVTSAKKKETSAARLTKLIEASAAEQRIGDSFVVRKPAKESAARRKAPRRSRS